MRKRERGTEYAEVIGLNKLVSAYFSAATGLSDKILPGVTGIVSRVHVDKNAEGRFRSIECDGGLFFETEMSCLDELAPYLTARDQTLSYFGFELAELKRFALTLSARAVDRRGDYFWNSAGECTRDLLPLLPLESC